MVRLRKCVVLLAAVLLACGDAGSGDPLNDATTSVCPPDQPHCDLIDEGCVIEETPTEDGPSLSPGSGTLGLGGPKSSAGKHLIWPNGRVPYKIASSVNSTTKSRLLSAMKEWNTKTKDRVRFVTAKSTDSAYVLVSEGSPRVSFVGWRSGKVSNLYLRDSEYITVIRHELGHVLGLEHEHRRKDRANFIKVVSSNIVNNSNCQYQFALCSNCPLLGKYDVKSVMHYRSTRDLSSCRVGGKAVLLNKDGSLINHEWLISTGDIAAIAELYGPPPSSGTGGATGSGGTGGGGTGGASTGGAGGVVGGAAGAAGAAGDAGAAGFAGAAGDDGVDGDGEWEVGTEIPSSGGAGGSGATGHGSTVFADGEESGCACRVGGSQRAPFVPGALMLLALGLSRRRARLT